MSHRDCKTITTQEICKDLTAYFKKHQKWYNQVRVDIVRLEAVIACCCCKGNLPGSMPEGDPGDPPDPPDWG